MSVAGPATPATVVHPRAGAALGVLRAVAGDRAATAVPDGRRGARGRRRHRLRLAAPTVADARWAGRADWTRPDKRDAAYAICERIPTRARRHEARDACLVLEWRPIRAHDWGLAVRRRRALGGRDDRRARSQQSDEAEQQRSDKLGVRPHPRSYLQSPDSLSHETSEQQFCAWLQLQAP
jgi:hypothetical protein